jgi:hypothetical protein
MSEDISVNSVHDTNLPSQALTEATPELSEVARLDSFIQERAGEAIRGCEFQETPQLKEALKGYYHDHYYLAGAIGAVIEGRYDSKLFDTILADPELEAWEKTLGSKTPQSIKDREFLSPNASVAAYRLARMAVGMRAEASEDGHFNLLRQCGAAINESLFQETSLGITTIGEDEIGLVSQLANKVKAAAGGRNIWEAQTGRVSFSDGETVIRMIQDSKERFWADTRHAGQLEFHGSGDLGGINLHGMLSRNQQVKRTGNMRTQTVVNYGGGTMHSVVPHFSEFYGMGGYVMGDTGGTIVVPLIKIIDQAPFARDGEYAAMHLKETGTEVLIPQPTLVSATGRVGAGQADTVGKGGRDRVFFSSPDETSGKLPDDYEINIHDKTNKPATYIVDRTLPDHNPKRELSELGMGYGLPDRLVIEVGDDVEGSIRDLQEQYLESYAHRGIVVPLRRGVFAQALENMPVEQIKGRNNPKIYNRYIPGSGKGSA